MKFRFPNIRIQVFAREPVLGKVKTRLLPAIGAERSLALYCRMIRDLVARIELSNLAPLELWVSSNPSHNLFVSICNEKEIFLQVGNDLGDRMDHAISSGLKRGSSVIVVGADCPSIDHAYLFSACAALDAGTHVVIGPARDGGYVLLGTRVPGHDLLQNVPWGSMEVMAVTMQRLRNSTNTYKLLEQRWDVDRPEDLMLLKTLQPPMDY